MEIGNDWRFALLAASLSLLIPASQEATARPLPVASEPGMVAGLAWQSPLPESTPVRPFFLPEGRYQSGHRGVDFLASLGQPVFAPAVGLVHFSGIVAGRPLISLRHEMGWLTSYEPVCPALEVGDAVLAGDVLGWICDSTDTAVISGEAHCPGLRCLHFSLRVDSEYRNPLLLLEGVSASRLLSEVGGEIGG